MHKGLAAIAARPFSKPGNGLYPRSSTKYPIGSDSETILAFSTLHSSITITYHNHKKSVIDHANGLSYTTNK